MTGGKLLAAYVAIWLVTGVVVCAGVLVTHDSRCVIALAIPAMVSLGDGAEDELDAEAEADDDVEDL